MLFVSRKVKISMMRLALNSVHFSTDISLIWKKKMENALFAGLLKKQKRTSCTNRTNGSPKPKNSSSLRVNKWIVPKTVVLSIMYLVANSSMKNISLSLNWMS